METYLRSFGKFLFDFALLITSLFTQEIFCSERATSLLKPLSHPFKNKNKRRLTTFPVQQGIFTTFPLAFILGPFRKHVSHCFWKILSTSKLYFTRFTKCFVEDRQITRKLQLIALSVGVVLVHKLSKKKKSLFNGHCEVAVEVGALQAKLALQ